ncbi:GH92 family glycosyl hydrolase [Actinoplanes sp. NPDC051411]|uniref:GH92 family glycosyl hydrolase n=1 Tax=Actinoplanes sp. NPDC051411 TaxID=3155522 RepID=UPI00341842D3
MLPTRVLAAIAGVAVTIPIGAAAQAAGPAPMMSDPVSYVNPLIGSTNLGNTYPGAVRPFGMIAWSPQTSKGNQISTPAPGGYQYTATRIRGLSLTHLSGVGCSGANGDIPIMPYVGDVTTSPTSDATDAVYASTFSHANEVASPGYYKVGLDSGAGAELTVTDRTGLGRFTFPADKPASLLFRTSLSETGSSDATVHIDPATRTITGSVSAGNFCGPQSTDNSHPYYTLHFVAKLDQPFTTDGTWKDATVTPSSTDASGGSGYASGRPVAGKGSGGYVTFAPGTTAVTMRVAISYADQAGAERNLAVESPTRLSFDTVKAQAAAAWNARLSKIRIGGGTPAQRTTFYTALYHSSLEPTLTSDVDGRYYGADDKIHRVSGRQRAQYGTFSGWDQYRAQVQLLAMLDPRQASDYAQSLFNYATQRGGEWDRWLLENGKTSVMSGDPSAAAIAAMYAFGARDFDARGALKSLIHAATVPTENDSSDKGCNVECFGERPSLQDYMSLGYVPADDCHCWGGAAETLEDSAADYGIAQLALALGSRSTYNTFLARSHNWRNVFDPDAAADTGLEHNIRGHITAITASGENAPNEGKAQLFDGDKGTKWLTFATTGWVAAQLDTPLTVSSYAVTSGNDEPTRDPADWQLQGSNNGTDWTTVDTRTGQTFAQRGQTVSYTVADPQAFSYYRFNVSKNGGADIVQVGELELADPTVTSPPPTDPSYAFTGWARDHFRDGTWAAGFTPSTGTGFVEGTSAQYTWMVYSDVTTLAQKMGGNATAVKRLDAFFRNPDGTFDLSATKGTRFDATNEPDIQTPYVYNYLGAAYKTQETVKAITDTKWNDTTGGIPGNDDAGTMSAWYVLSALGLYPTVPTRAELALTTPLFPHADVRLGTGHHLVIDAPSTDTEHYIKGLKVDGRSTTKAWLPARAVTSGAHLSYSLSTTPNLKWGSGKGDTPPQN